MKLAALRLVAALTLLAAGGCAPTTAAPPAATVTPPPAAEGPTNFAAPSDLFRRYPEMRRQTI